MSYLGNKLKEKQAKYAKRKNRANKKVKENSDKVRVVIAKSNKFVSAQALDQEGKVLAQVSDKWQKGNKSEAAKAAGLEFAKVLKEKKVDAVAFDRNGFLYHGRVAAFANGLREWGIKL